MNSTNRALNRAMILVVGLLALGSAAVLLAVNVLPAFRRGWQGTAPKVLQQVETFLRQNGNGILIGLVALLAVLIVLLLVFVFRQGHGHTGRLITAAVTENGQTEVSARVAKDALERYLSERPEFVASHVSAYLVRQRPTLKISVTCRRGVSPRDAVTAVRKGVDALDLLLGTQVPALLQVSGGFRSRVAGSTRTQ